MFKQMLMMVGIVALLLCVSNLMAQEKPLEENKETAQQEEVKALTQNEIFQQDITQAIKGLLSSNYLESEEAKNILLESGNRSLKPLLDELEKSISEESRYFICEILGNLRNGTATNALIKQLDREDIFGASIASAAARALGTIGNDQSTQALIAQLTTDRIKTDIELRYEVIKALGNLRAIESIKLLHAHLDDSSETVNRQIVSCAVIEALGKMRDHSAIELIAKKLSDKSREEWSGLSIGIYAAKALSRITGMNKGPIWELNDKKTEKTLKEWEDWWKAEQEKKKKGDNEDQKPPQDAEKKQSIDTEKDKEKMPEKQPK